MNILKGHYRSIPKVIADVEKLRSGKFVRSVSPVSKPCLESYPCQHPGGCIIKYTDNTTNQYNCSSVEMGAIMYYYGIKNEHFTSYIDAEHKRQIDDLRDPTIVIPKTNLQHGGNCTLF